jgi:hypothetical protein
MKTLKQILEATKPAPATKGEIGVIDPASETSLSPKSVGEKRFKDKHQVKVTPDANGNDDKLFKASNVKMGDRHPTNHGYNPGEDSTKYESVDPEKREDIVKGMKKNLGDFRKRYGKDAKSVMYATANKMAKEDTDPFAGFAEDTRELAREMFELLGENNKQIFNQLCEDKQYATLTKIVNDVMGESA